MGEVFAGRYELLDPVAEGGMGSVWLIRDRADGQVKIAKILRQSDASSLLRFVREQSVRIDHRHVVTPLSWAGMDDRVLFTMPLVRGGSVADLLKERGRALPVRWVGALLDQTLQGLEAVHAAGIVHRDVKPANLLLEPTGRQLPHVRLTDFGIAAPVDEPRMTHASMAIGTPGYMAPEQWHGSHPDPRQDLYAVAAVGLEMLTGLRPPASPDALSAPDPATLPEPHELAERLVAVLMRSAAEDPDDRHPSAAAMRADLRDLALERSPEVGDAVEVRDHFAPGSATPVVAGGSAVLTQPELTQPDLTQPEHRPGPTRLDPSTLDSAGLEQGGVRTALQGATRVEHPASTRVEPAGGAPARRRSAVPGLLLVLLGLALLVAAVIVGLG